LDDLLDVQSVRYTAAGGVVVHGDRVLVLRRPGGVVVHGDCVLVLRRPGRGEVRLPKGHVEPGESPQETALREVREESGCTGLEVRADLGTQNTRGGTSCAPSGIS